MGYESTGELNAISRNLDHHGLVAATFKDLKVGERINARIFNGDPRRIVSSGDAVLAMVLNGLGFTNRRIYLSPQFFESKPVEDLVSPSLQAKHLDDHALGKALDEISAYSASRLFGEIAMEIGVEHKLFQKTAHMDSTSFSVQGEYEQEGVTAISVTHGYSKDHRPDLNESCFYCARVEAVIFHFGLSLKAETVPIKRSLQKRFKRSVLSKSNLRAAQTFDG